jgi:transcriptional regulator with XRE-family HTH domain
MKTIQARKMTTPLEGQITPEEAGRRIRLAREKVGFSQTQAAKKLKITQPRLSEMERGLKVTTWTRLVAIVKILGLDPKVIVPEFFGLDSKSRRKRA